MANETTSAETKEKPSKIKTKQMKEIVLKQTISHSHTLKPSSHSHPASTKDNFSMFSPILLSVFRNTEASSLKTVSGD
jgi:hypothetical protein